MNRQPALDGLRGVAILWVLAYHLFALPARTASLHALPWLQSLAAQGWMGVNLFFVLSGYLITRGLADQPRDRYYFGIFALRRVFRIVPAYALVLLLFPVARALWPPSFPGAAAVFNPAIPLWSYAAFLQNLYMVPTGSLGNDWLRVLWSLAVEVQFYALICVVVFLVPRRRLAVALLALAAVSVAFRYFSYFRLTDPDLAIVVLLPCRLDSFVLGGLLALAPDARLSGMRTAAGAALLAGSVAFLHSYSAGAFGSRTVYLLPLYYLVISLGCAGALDLCVRPVGPVAWLMESDVLVEAGELSYFVYLFHMPVALCLFHFVLGTSPALGTLPLSVAMVGSAAAVFVLAEVSYKYMEDPLIRLSHTLLRRPRPAPPA